MENCTKSRVFSSEEATVLEEIILHRRDVRGNRFLNKPIDNENLNKIIWAAVHAPSVGFSQPWEFVIIKKEKTKEAVYDVFTLENSKASSHFKSQAGSSKYERLKLEGIKEAPVNIAVFYQPSDKPVLGQTAMPEAGPYSVVCAIQNMWLMARSLNIGMGWVSILNPDEVKKILRAKRESRLIAYLCLGYTDYFYSKPELEKIQWAKKKTLNQSVFMERFT